MIKKIICGNAIFGHGRKRIFDTNNTNKPKYSESNGKLKVVLFNEKDGKQNNFRFTCSLTNKEKVDEFLTRDTQENLMIVFKGEVEFRKE
ncbi:hypothetical protein [Campylobacter sp. CCS1377]|uniref:Uncharacterized protein n=1 Tax=Campylobacter sp. CCS1377 TaxID=3158229 RepID=A0AAU7E604_9BACT|nr:hypothetical protein [Campylobacter jejuni]